MFVQYGTVGVESDWRVSIQEKKRERSTPSAIIKNISTIIYDMLTSLSVLIGLRNELAETLVVEIPMHPSVWINLCCY